jgi:hypothetical protein
MSLHHLAQTLKHQGRGKDTELIHMTKGEIAGLHALARAHGGSLTTNPHTGLPEAGFLDTMLSIGGGLHGGCQPAASLDEWRNGLWIGWVG